MKHFLLIHISNSFPLFSDSSGSQLNSNLGNKVNASDLAWKFHGNIAGDQTPSYTDINGGSWNELLIQAQYSGKFVEFYFPRTVIHTAGSKHWFAGSYISSTISVGAEIWTGNTQFNLGVFSNNGTTVTDKSTVTLTVYYR